MEEATQELDREMVEALNKAKEKNIPQGLVVAILQGHLFIETQEMIGDGWEG